MKVAGIVAIIFYLLGKSCTWIALLFRLRKAYANSLFETSTRFIKTMKYIIAAQYISLLIVTLFWFITDESWFLICASILYVLFDIAYSVSITYIFLKNLVRVALFFKQKQNNHHKYLSYGAHVHGECDLDGDLCKSHTNKQTTNFCPKRPVESSKNQTAACVETKTNINNTSKNNNGDSIHITVGMKAAANKPRITSDSIIGDTKTDNSQKQTDESKYNKDKIEDKKDVEKMRDGNEKKKQNKSKFQHSKETIFVMTKYTVLTCLIIFTTSLMLICLIISRSNTMIFILRIMAQLDGIINPLCLVLFFSFCDNIYKCLCKCCHISCAKLVTHCC